MYLRLRGLSRFFPAIVSVGEGESGLAGLLCLPVCNVVVGIGLWILFMGNGGHFSEEGCLYLTAEREYEVY